MSNRMNIFLILNLAIVAVSASRIKPRIIKGKNAVEKQFPYQVGISLKKGGKSSSWCGGVLIDNSWVLTAAHCIKEAKFAKIYLGTTDRSKPRVEINVTSNDIIQHEAYDKRYKTNDITLIKIPAVTFDDHIQKVNLPDISSNYSTYTGELVIASGWGRTSDLPGSGLVPNLQYTTMKVVENSECELSFSTKYVKPSTLCVTPVNGGSVCRGDSGGPLVLNGKILIGITSFGHKKGCESGKPFGFTRITSYLPWISEKTGISY